jgi:hypothetical protein
MNQANLPLHLQVKYFQQVCLQYSLYYYSYRG